MRCSKFSIFSGAALVFCLLTQVFPVSIAASEVPETPAEIQGSPLVLPIPRALDFEPDALLLSKPTLMPDSMDESILNIVAESLRWLGTPYVYGGSSFSGVDCSGFVGTVLSRASGTGKIYPRTSEGYAVVGDRATGPMSPGDILLFAWQGSIYHVGIALSPDTFIHSASEGERTGVIISSLDDGSWRRRLAGVRRLSSGPAIR